VRWLGLFFRWGSAAPPAGNPLVFRVAAIVRAWQVAAARRAWILAAAARTWEVSSMNEISAVKDPNSVEDFALNWTLEIGSDTISSATWSAVGVTVDSDSLAGAVTTARLSGGTVGKPARTTCHVVLASGQVKERTIRLSIQEM